MENMRVHREHWFNVIKKQALVGIPLKGGQVRKSCREGKGLIMELPLRSFLTSNVLSEILMRRRIAPRGGSFPWDATSAPVARNIRSGYKYERKPADTSPWLRKKRFYKKKSPAQFK